MFVIITNDIDDHLSKIAKTTNIYAGKYQFEEDLRSGLKYLLIEVSCDFCTCYICVYWLSWS